MMSVCSSHCSLHHMCICCQNLKHSINKKHKSNHSRMLVKSGSRRYMIIICCTPGPSSVNRKSTYIVSYVFAQATRHTVNTKPIHNNTKHQDINIYQCSLDNKPYTHIIIILFIIPDIKFAGSCAPNHLR